MSATESPDCQEKSKTLKSEIVNPIPINPQSQVVEKKRRKYVKKRSAGTFQFVGLNARSRNGCLNCRKSSIKCDETKPSCNTCLRKNKVCQYGEIKKGKCDFNLNTLNTFNNNTITTVKNDNEKSTDSTGVTTDKTNSKTVANSSETNQSTAIDNNSTKKAEIKSTAITPASNTVKDSDNIHTNNNTRTKPFKKIKFKPSKLSPHPSSNKYNNDKLYQTVLITTVPAAGTHSPIERYIKIPINRFKKKKTGAKQNSATSLENLLNSDNTTKNNSNYEKHQQNHGKQSDSFEDNSHFKGKISSVRLFHSNSGNTSENTDSDSDYKRLERVLHTTDLNDKNENLATNTTDFGLNSASSPTERFYHQYSSPQRHHHSSNRRESSKLSVESNYHNEEQSSLSNAHSEINQVHTGDSQYDYPIDHSERYNEGDAEDERYEAETEGDGVRGEDDEEEEEDEYEEDEEEGEEEDEEDEEGEYYYNNNNNNNSNFITLEDFKDFNFNENDEEPSTILIGNVRRFINNTDIIKRATSKILESTSTRTLSEEDSNNISKLDNFLTSFFHELKNEEIELFEISCNESRKLFVSYESYEYFLKAIIPMSKQYALILDCMLVWGKIIKNRNYPTSIEDENSFNIEQVDKKNLIKFILNFPTDKVKGPEGFENRISVLTSIFIINSCLTTNADVSNMGQLFLEKAKSIIKMSGILEKHNQQNIKPIEIWLLVNILYQDLFSSKTHSDSVSFSLEEYEFIFTHKYLIRIPFQGCLRAIFPLIAEIISRANESNEVYKLFNNKEKINNWMYTEKFNLIISKGTSLDIKIHYRHPVRTDLKSIDIEELELHLSLYELFQFSCHLYLKIFLKRLPPIVPEAQLYVVKLINLLQFLVNTQIRQALAFPFIVTGMNCVLKEDREYLLSILQSHKKEYRSKLVLDRVEKIILKSWEQNPDGLHCIDWFEITKEFGWHFNLC
ncbi:hypothetical protein B5S31_g2077 [[Candida] boidinii]|nr:hypothetical protein B5S31_g2077 [[Candida] boidinii]OWB77224.1 hypothetical protein B5S32_g1385 [[Candida] boidinii]